MTRYAFSLIALGMLAACGKAPEPGVRVEIQTVEVPGNQPVIFVSMTDDDDGLGANSSQVYSPTRDGIVRFPARAYSFGGELRYGDTATLTINDLSCDYQRQVDGQESMFKKQCYGTGDPNSPQTVRQGDDIRFYVQNSKTSVTIEFVVE